MMLWTSFAVLGETAENQQLMRYFIQDLSLNIKFFYILFCCRGNSSWMATIVSASKNVNTSYWLKICSFQLREKCPNPNSDTFYVVLIWFIFQNAWISMVSVTFWPHDHTRWKCMDPGPFKDLFWYCISHKLYLLGKWDVAICYLIV